MFVPGVTPAEGVNTSRTPWTGSARNERARRELSTLVRLAPGPSS